MRSVYKSAGRTLIWLGEDDSTVGLAMGLAVAIVRKMMRFDQPHPPEPNSDSGRSIAREGSDDLQDMKNLGTLVSQQRTFRL